MRSVAPLAVLPERFHVAANRSHGRDDVTGLPGRLQRAQERRELRRANFAIAQRLSLAEVAYLHPFFDPGPEYDR